MAAQALADYLDQLGAEPVAAALRATILALAGAAISVREEIASGALGAAFEDGTGARNAGGDVQKPLDLYADQVFLEAMGNAPVAVYGSEELEHPVLLDARAPLAIAIDPLDGSSNIDTNVSIGTIFAILPVAGDPERDSMASLLQPGSAQLAAGFFCYGPQLSLVLTVGRGTQIFVYGPKVGAFMRTRPDVSIPHRTPEFAINVSNQRHWEDAIRHYINDCMQGVDGPHGRDFNMRWIASLVAESYRIVVRGGVFLYPADRRKGYGSGRLRLVYEANPIAFLIEEAGGAATDGVLPVRNVKPNTLHQRTPLVFGSRDEVNQVARYHVEIDHAGIHSPLFGARGLFRN